MTKIERERAEFVKAMECIVRHVNNEEYLMTWLELGVPDGDIDSNTSLEDIVVNGYTSKKTVEEWADLFLRIMSRARKDGGLYIG